MSVLPLTKFNQCVNTLIAEPNREQFHEAITMLDTAFKARKLDTEHQRFPLSIFCG